MQSDPVLRDNLFSKTAEQNSTEHRVLTPIYVVCLHARTTNHLLLFPSYLPYFQCLQCSPYTEVYLVTLSVK